MPYKIMEGWDYPVMSRARGFFQGLGFTRGRFGILKKQLIWFNVIDPDKTTGSPPALHSDTLLVTKDSLPFSLEVVKKVKFIENTICEGEIISSSEVVVDSAPYALIVSDSDIYSLTVNGNYYSKEYKLTELIEGETLMNRYIPRRSGIPG